MSQTNTGSDAELACLFSTPLSIISHEPASMSDTLSLRRVGASQGVQRWHVQASVAQSDNGVAFFVTAVTSGYHKKMYIRMPQLWTGTDEAQPSWTPFTAQANAAGVTAIQTAGFTNAKVGEFIQFANHYKVYVIRSNVGGVTTIFPPLVNYVPSNTAIKFGKLVTLNAKIDKDAAIGIKYENGIISDPGQYTFIETK